MVKKPKCAGCLLEFNPDDVAISQGGGPAYHFECRPGGAISDAIEELASMRAKLAVAESRAAAAGDEAHHLGWKLQLLNGDMARIEGQLDDVRRMRRDLEVGRQMQLSVIKSLENEVERLTQELKKQRHLQLVPEKKDERSQPDEAADQADKSSD